MAQERMQTFGQSSFWQQAAKKNEGLYGGGDQWKKDMQERAASRDPANYKQPPRSRGRTKADILNADRDRHQHGILTREGGGVPENPMTCILVGADAAGDGRGKPAPGSRQMTVVRSGQKFGKRRFEKPYTDSRGAVAKNQNVGSCFHPTKKKDNPTRLGELGAAACFNHDDKETNRYHRVCTKANKETGYDIVNHTYHPEYLKQGTQHTVTKVPHLNTKGVRAAATGPGAGATQSARGAASKAGAAIVGNSPLSARRNPARNTKKSDSNANKDRLMGDGGRSLTPAQLAFRKADIPDTDTDRFNDPTAHRMNLQRVERGQEYLPSGRRAPKGTKCYNASLKRQQLLGESPASAHAAIVFAGNCERSGVSHPIMLAALSPQRRAAAAGRQTSGEVKELVLHSAGPEASAEELKKQLRGRPKREAESFNRIFQRPVDDDEHHAAVTNEGKAMRAQAMAAHQREIDMHQAKVATTKYTQARKLPHHGEGTYDIISLNDKTTGKNVSWKKGNVGALIHHDNDKYNSPSGRTLGNVPGASWKTEFTGLDKDHFISDSMVSGDGPDWIAEQHKRTVGEAMVRHATTKEKTSVTVDLDGRVLQWKPTEAIHSRPDMVGSY